MILSLSTLYRMSVSLVRSREYSVIGSDKLCKSTVLVTVDAAVPQNGRLSLAEREFQDWLEP